MFCLLLTKNVNSQKKQNQMTQTAFYAINPVML